ncbi:hypothetical protein DWB84_07675 [Saccharophagus sp. K07]|nr:hypothetical protein [Saccharophagus sp. K07]
MCNTGRMVRGTQTIDKNAVTMAATFKTLLFTNVPLNIPKITSNETQITILIPIFWFLVAPSANNIPIINIQSLG